MEFTREIIYNAAERYLNMNTSKRLPEQFNIRFSERDGWDCEFHEYESCWTEGYTTWESDKDIIEQLFFNQDPDLINLSSWESDWNDK